MRGADVSSRALARQPALGGAGTPRPDVLARFAHGAGYGRMSDRGRLVPRPARALHLPGFDSPPRMLIRRTPIRDTLRDGVLAFGEEGVTMEPGPAEREGLEALLLAHLNRCRPAGVVSVYLFGSHAAGRAHAESDVDVGVLLDRTMYPSARDRFEQRLRLTGDLGAALGRGEIDLVILNDAPPTLARRVVTAGRRLFCSDPEADHRFVRDVQLRAADLAPFLQKMGRLKLDAIRR